MLDADSKPIAEAGGGLSFDSTETAAAAKWLGDAAGALLTAADREVLATALNKAVQPPAKDKPKAEAPAAPAKSEPSPGIALAATDSDATSSGLSIPRWLWPLVLGSLAVVIILAGIAKRRAGRAAVEHG